MATGFPGKRGAISAMSEDARLRAERLALAPVEAPAAQPNTKMAQAMSRATRINSRIPAPAWAPGAAIPTPNVAAPNLTTAPGAAPPVIGPPAPPRPINAPPLGFASGPVRSNLINFNTAPDPIPVNATTSPGAAPGRAVIPVDAGRALSAPYAAPAPRPNALIPVDAGRSFSPPFAENAPKSTALATIDQPRGFATPSGRELALTTDAGRATQGIKIPNGYTPPKVNPATGAYMGRGPASPLPMTQPGGRAALAKGIAKGAGLGVAGYGAAQLMNNIGQNDAPGKNTETRANVNAIPTGGNAPAPTAQPYSWWTDTDAGRNISNTLNALAPVGGGVIGSLRAGSSAARLSATSQAVAGGVAAGANGFKSQAAAPAEQLAAQPAKPATQTVANPYADAPPTNAAPATTPAATDAPAADPNQVKVERQANGVMSFSGGPNIGQDGGQISYNAGTSGFKPGGYGVSNLGGPIAPSAESQRILTNPDGSRWTANDSAIMEANLRDGVNPYRGTSRATGEDAAAVKNRMMQLAMSPAGTSGRIGALRILTSMQGEETARRGQDVTAAGQMASTGIAQYRAGLEGQELGMKQTAAGFGNRASARIEALQAAYQTAAPEDQAAIAEQLRVMTGKDKPDANRFTVVPGGQEWDSTANAAITRPAQVINNQTGEFVNQGQPQAKANAPTTKAQYDKLPKGARYTAPDGQILIKG